jgi:C-terminal processing protease CtpA/Prc
LDGLVIDRVVRGSIAYEAQELEKGDKIVAINKHEIDSKESLLSLLRDGCDGPSISITVEKGILGQKGIPFFGIFNRAEVSLPTADLFGEDSKPDRGPSGEV